MPSTSRGRKMSENEVSIIYSHSKYNAMTFSKELSSLIKERGYEMINIKQDDITGEIGIEINNEKGVRLHVSGKVETSTFNLKMVNKGWIERLCDVLGLSKDGTRHVLKISKNLSTVDRCLFFRLSKK